MSVEGQLAGLRANERRNVAVDGRDPRGLRRCRRLGTDGLGRRGRVRRFVVGLLAARRQRIPSLDALADRIDRAKGTHGSCAPPSPRESGSAFGSPSSSSTPWRAPTHC
jgi:hypothetical protein